VKISTSILSIKEQLQENIEKLGRTSTDYIHLDIMDGIFVENQNDFLEQRETLLKTNKPLDVHLMVEDVEKYIDRYISFTPSYITFHLEIHGDIFSCIHKIKQHCKVGLSIKPGTPVEKLKPYLEEIDLILIMSVEPGKGGQKFLENSTQKIEKLKKLKKTENYHYEIAVDGGINDVNIDKVKDCDIVVVGSYITNEKDYEKQIKNLK
jgi:ribulose-phosphate 3-epimerase